MQYSKQDVFEMCYSVIIITNTVAKMFYISVMTLSLECTSYFVYITCVYYCLSYTLQVRIVSQTVQLSKVVDIAGALDLNCVKKVRKPFLIFLFTNPCVFFCFDKQIRR